MSIVDAEILEFPDSHAGKSLVVGGLCGGAKALFLSQIVHKNPNRGLFIIVPDEERAQEFSDDLKFFANPEDEKRLRIFPESSSLPYTRLSPEPKAWAGRLKILNEYIHGDPIVTIASVSAVMRRVPPRNFLSKRTRVIGIREKIDPYELANYLAAVGYEDVGMVEDEGSFARRGGIVDLWPPTSKLPVRIELDGEKIASMRNFDPATQRSKKDANEIILIPVRDIPFDENARGEAASRIRQKALDADISAREWRSITEAIREGIAFAGIETFLPLFHDKTATIFNYLSQDSLIILDEETDVEAAANAHYKEVCEIAANTQSPERIVKPEEIILDWRNLGEEITKFKCIRWNSPELSLGPHFSFDIYGNADIRPLISGLRADKDMLMPLVARIKEWRNGGTKVVFTCHTELQAGRIKDLMRLHGVELVNFEAPFNSLFEMSSNVVRIKTGRLSAGFKWQREGLVVITDEEVFGHKVPKRSVVSKSMEPFTSFAEISDGDFLVHEQHGIGRFRGLGHLVIDNIPGDYLLIEYLGGDKLYLPVYRLNLVGRYIGAGDAPVHPDKLGGFRFSQIQKKVDASVRVMAKELLDLYAAREIFPGFPFPPGDATYEEFAASFPYDETWDQTRAIDDVMQDMGLERPMDRLVCGDVGYGKTEVAMRAAFRAAFAGKQVALLVPTTVLALQHYESFVRRFKDTAVTIEMLSRFKSAKEQRLIIDGISRGQVDVVIGTHRLIQKDVRFRNLGLLIIDEEHRFGVRHKEKIKKLKASIDVMTLTATPIPRTLNLSLSGIRDISIINTPPADRQSITTYVTPFDEGIIRHAILREIARGGQVFFVHNRVETIRSMLDRLKKLVPEARIVVGHGQMKETELEKAMVEFIERRADVLLCTTIIESGLDIPSANTIIIHRADTFGLAQLYQLRGRVGRSNVKANAYLLTPESGEISFLAKKRLTVLKRFTELGSGFQIAMHDLEFRGAGNILGSAQSGHIAAIGYEMYARLLERAVRKLKGKKIEEEIDPELSLMTAAFLPEEYVPDETTRIDIYRRLANRQSDEEILQMGEELADRFGELPKEVVNLLRLMEIKIVARRLKMKQVAFDGATIACQLDASTPLKPEGIVKLSEKEGFKCRFVPPDKLLLPLNGTHNGEKTELERIKNSLSRLLTYVSEEV